MHTLWKADAAAINDWLADPPVAQAIDQIVERAKAHGVVAGEQSGVPDVTPARISKRFRFVTLGSDARVLAADSQQLLARMK